ncbi:hypothetical protein DEIPH_ctg009orf0030 [Deinococcus phoenicis]|uniref:Uncharacterized protein n=1 Tax=Deinococcus phoenicis TaxID=1476583 RepID=A0A016QTS4_9DEIO|nr:hypothetical protein [Deinococcus phoenicis]EYB69287.1 hypothetical protein DEIPH_ctg009orf0030 [Deinococcus phoenicis]
MNMGRCCWPLAALLLLPHAAAQLSPPVSTTLSSATPQTALLLDGQRLSLNVAFRPGDPSGPAYPPLGAFSKTNPAYYAVHGNGGPLRLTVSTVLKSAALVLRAQSVPPLRGPALPTDRVEYSVNGGPWQRTGAVQVVALLPASGQATYDITLRLRLEGDEPAGERALVLSWMVEPQTLQPQTPAPQSQGAR